MADDSKKYESEVKPEIEESGAAEAQKSSPVKEATGGGGGWGGWGFSLSYLSDLQKAAAEAAEEISRNVCVSALGNRYFLSWLTLLIDLLPFLHTS